MNEQELEQLLREVEPRKASLAFKERLLLEISAAQSTPLRKSSVLWKIAIPAAAAALVIFAALWSQHHSSPARPAIAADTLQPPEDRREPRPQPGVFEPSAAKTLCVSYKKEPLRADNRSFSRHSYELVDCMEWVNKANGNRIRIVRPRSAKIILCDNSY